MSRHESDMHRRLRLTEDELHKTRLLYREALDENRRLRLALNGQAGQFEEGALLRDKREGR